MSDSTLIDPANYAPPNDLGERGMKDPNSSITQPKRRGAPNGNRNALRHGFYAKNLGMASPANFDEREMRNLLGEAAMLKDYMYILYTCNLEIRDSAVLAETLRALSLAGMALSRLLQVHNEIRITRPASASTIKDLLIDMDSAAGRANRLAASFNNSLNDEDEE